MDNFWDSSDGKTSINIDSVTCISWNVIEKAKKTVVHFDGGEYINIVNDEDRLSLRQFVSMKTGWKIVDGIIV